MTWYTGTCDSNCHELTIHVRFMIKCVCYTGIWIHWFYDHGVAIPNGLVTIGRTPLVGVGHLRSDSVVSLMLYTVCYVMIGTLALYYRSLGIAPTLLRKGNILGKPHC
jgi:hypothetical protein